MIIGCRVLFFGCLYNRTDSENTERKEKYFFSKPDFLQNTVGLLQWILLYAYKTWISLQMHSKLCYFSFLAEKHCKWLVEMTSTVGKLKENCWIYLIFRENLFAWNFVSLFCHKPCTRQEIIHASITILATII